MVVAGHGVRRVDWVCRVVAGVVVIGGYRGETHLAAQLDVWRGHLCVSQRSAVCVAE